MHAAKKRVVFAPQMADSSNNNRGDGTHAPGSASSQPAAANAGASDDNSPRASVPGQHGATRGEVFATMQGVAVSGSHSKGESARPQTAASAANSGAHGNAVPQALPAHHAGSQPVPHGLNTHSQGQSYWTNAPATPGQVNPSSSEPVLPGDIPAKEFTSFLKLSLRRAFRLRIDPSEVLPAERTALALANPPITEPNLAAFLAWRRSVLFLVAVALVPLTLLGLLDSMRGDNVPLPIRMVRLGPALAEGLFCLVCWRQLNRWAQWRVQRRRLFYGWLLFMLAPFLVFVYPLRHVFEELYAQRQSVTASVVALGMQSGYKRSMLPYFFPMLAILQLAPKAISLMPGLVRSSMVIKLLFPGSAAPGWLIALAAPMYAIFAFTILIIPYQLTGSVWFIIGILGIVGGQIILARAGYSLARPQTEEEALGHIRKVRTWYLVVMIISAILIVVAMGSVVDVLGLRISDVFLAVLKFETNVLILTIIGADLVVTNLDRARNYTEGGEAIEDQAEQKIAAFVGLDKDNA